MSFLSKVELKKRLILSQTKSETQHKKEIEKRLKLQYKELKFDPTKVYTNHFGATVDYDEWVKDAVLGDDDIVEQYFAEQGIPLDSIDLDFYRDRQNDMISDLSDYQK